MKGKLIIHIGPPKTATTSLQYYWQELKIKRFKYIGINQPRQKNDNTLAKDLYNYCNSVNDDDSSFSSIKDRLSEYIKKYDYVVFSEEMILLEDKSISYLKKLNRLYEITKIFNPIVSFCIRDVEQSYFSYYIEIFHLLPMKLQGNFEEFQKSSYADCFKYKSIYENLVNLGFKRINFFNFNLLVSKSLTMEDILGITDSNYSFIVKLGKENVSKNKNLNLLVKKKNILKSLIIDYNHLIPKFLKGYGLGVSLNKKYGKDKAIKLEKEVISIESRKVYKNDLAFFLSLKDKK